MSRGPHVCPDCGGHYRNKWAHAEECTGPAKDLQFTGRYQCRRCFDTSSRGGFCPCGGRKVPTFVLTSKEKGPSEPESSSPQSPQPY